MVYKYLSKALLVFIPTKIELYRLRSTLLCIQRETFTFEMNRKVHGLTILCQNRNNFSATIFVCLKVLFNKIGILI